MRESDLDTFGELLDAVCGLLSRGAYRPNATNTALFFRALAKYDIADVRAALDAHVGDPTRGRFVPVPADLIAQIAGAAAADGRLGPEEAWATAIVAGDEAATVVWTDEMAQAWEIARTVFEAGDEVAARMAFREAYIRLVTQARAAREPLRWRASLGHDARQREAVIQAAVATGRLARSELDDVPRLDAPVPTPLLARLGAMLGMQSMADRSREKLRETADELRTITAEMAIDTTERDRMRQVKAEIAQQANAYATAIAPQRPT